MPNGTRSQFKSRLTLEQANALFHLDNNSGELIWKINIGTRAKAGSKAGSITSKGYFSVKVFGMQYQLHRIVYLIANGDWPKFSVDHINGIKTDNRPCNLRDASCRKNSLNRTVVNKNNSGISRVPGCYWSKAAGRWKAVCTINGKAVLQREFHTMQEAEKCVLEFRRATLAGMQ